MSEPDARHALRAYLENHWAGAGAGLSLARRLAERCPGPPWDERLARLADDVAEDDTALSELRRRLGLDTGWVSAGGLKRAAGEVGEHLSRLASVWPLANDTAADHVLEVEAMMAGVTDKRALWRSLQNIAPHGTLGGVDVSAMIARADAQLDTLRRYHRHASRSAFGGGYLVAQ